MRRRQTAGQGLRAIARATGLARGTARRFAATQSFPARAIRAPEPSMLDPHVVWLQVQLALGRDNASALWRERRARGYPGGPGQVLVWVRQRRLVPAKNGPHRWRVVIQMGVTSVVAPGATPALPSPK